MNYKNWISLDVKHYLLWERGSVAQLWHSCGTVNSGGTGSNPVVDILNKIFLTNCFLNGLTRPLFVYLRSFQIQILQKNWTLQRNSNSDRRSIRRACWPLNHHHGPIFTILSFRKNENKEKKTQNGPFFDISNEV